MKDQLKIRIIVFLMQMPEMKSLTSLNIWTVSDFPNIEREGDLIINPTNQSCFFFRVMEIGKLVEFVIQVFISKPVEANMSIQSLKYNQSTEVQKASFND